MNSLNSFSSPRAVFYPENMPSFNQTQPSIYNNNSISLNQQLHPYNSSAFLNSTFNSDSSYIQAFLSLAHPEKLKMFLLMQEKQMYGEFTDRPAYQNILQEIAKRAHNLNLFYRQDTQKPNSKQIEEKSSNNDLQNKINMICDETFKKLNVGEQFIKQKSKQSNRKSEQEEFGQFEEMGNNNQQTNENNEEDEFGQFEESHELGKDNSECFADIHDNQQEWTESISTPSTVQGQAPYENNWNSNWNVNNINFEELRPANAPNQNKLSIWELELKEEQVSNFEPNIREVFKKKQEDPKLHVNEMKEEGEIDFNNWYGPSETPQNLNQLNSMTLNVQFNKAYSPPTQGSYFNNQEHFHPSAKDSLNFNTIDPQEPNHDQEEWNQVVVSNHTISNTANLHISQDLPKNHSKKQIPAPLECQFDFLAISALTQSNLNKEAEIIQVLNHNSNEFDFLGQEPLKSSIQIEKPEIFFKENINGVSQNPKFVFEFEQNVNDFNKSEKTTNNEKAEDSQFIYSSNISQQASSLSNTQLFQSDAEQKYKILQVIKVKISQKDRNFLRAELKHKSFECNSQFYKILLHHLRDLSLEHSNQYSHIRQQLQIVNEIHALTEMYTSTVQEEDEEKVQEALKKSKNLYKHIYNKSTATENIVEHLILKPENNSIEFGVLFKLGKIVIDTFMNQELIEKIISYHSEQSKQNQQNILQAFCCLYILQKFNISNKFKSIAENIVHYTNQQYQIYRDADPVKLDQFEKAFPLKYQIYSKGLYLLGNLSFRAISLMKICSIKSNCNFVKSLKNCKDLKAKFKQYDSKEDQDLKVLPQRITRFFSENAAKNVSVYDLHATFMKVIELQPLCSICLQDKTETRDGNLFQNSWYHFNCLNLMKVIEGKTAKCRKEIA